MPLFHALTALALLVTCSAHADYQFNSYPAELDPSLSLKEVDFTRLPDASRFKTVLEYHLGSAPNFAGQYVIISNGCGTMCQINHVIDVASGAVIDSIESSFGVCFSSTSRLLITNPRLSEHFPDNIPDWAAVGYYLLDNDEVAHLASSKQSYSGPCESGQ